MAANTTYGDISPRTAAYAVTQLLKRGMPYLAFEKFGQSYPLPSNATKVAKFRRYYLSGSTGAAGSGSAASAWAVPLSLTPLTEGVTPSGRKLANTDYTVTIQQYGDYTTITDVILDTHEDQVLQAATETLGESAALTVETLRYNVLKSGTNVFYANGLITSSVNTAFTGAAGLALQRQVTTALNRQNAKKITNIIASTPDYNTKSVEASFVAVVHPDLESDIRGISGFVKVADYGPHHTPWENEIGTVEQVRYISTTVATPWTDAGDTKGTMRSTSGVKADVYPILIFARDAYGLVPLKGKSSLTPMVVNPKPAPGDPLAQRGTVGWKTYQATVILNDAWMARVEVAATA